MANSLHRRELSFRDFDDIVRDVETLHAKDYEKAGNWDLAQVCGHLAKWLSYPLDGFPKSGCFIGTMLWMMRITVGKGIKKKILTTGKFKEGGPTVPDSLVASGSDETAAVAKLKEMIERFKSHTGEIHPSPLFGKMSRDELTRLHLIHCAHHLSFLAPKAS
jgi:Protein of unknown function (DUF1569)